MGVSDIAEWWDRQKRESERVLEEWVVENTQWWAVGAATLTQTAMDLGQGFVDVLRLGEGTAQGTLGGTSRDALRLLVFLGPLAKAGGTLSRILTPLANSGRLRLAVQVDGVTGPCTFQAVNNALSLTRGRSLFVTARDMAKAIGENIDEAAKVGKNYKIAAWVDDLLPAMKKLGASTKEIKNLTEIDQVINLARAETGPVIFAMKATVRTPLGQINEIVHSVIAYRSATGGVRFADYGGKFVRSLDELIGNLGYGAPIGRPALHQASNSAVVVDGAWLTGRWAVALANGSVLVLSGWGAIETDDGVELAAPVEKAAGLLNDSAGTSEEVVKGSFFAYSERKKGKVRPRLPAAAVAAGKGQAPASHLLTGVQFRLNALGFGSGHADGIFGPITRGAVRRFQKSYVSLAIDGIPGPKTQAALVEQTGY